MFDLGDTIVLASVYGPKAGMRKNENPENASIEVIWKPKTGQIGFNELIVHNILFLYLGKSEKEYEMILRRTLKCICLPTINPNTTTSVVLQVVNDDGAVSVMLLPCAINAVCAALIDAGTPLTHLAVAICCSLAENGSVFLDPTKLRRAGYSSIAFCCPFWLQTRSYISAGMQEIFKMQASTYLVFPNSILSVLPKGSLHGEDELLENGIITSVTHGVISVDDYLHCLERGRSASAKISDFLRRSLQSQVPSDS
ncbi:hypothetical protein HHK36_014167 [Tetracentron sinense]|uniref:Exoribonuclease phosphorolytic domain-containing protein n=1 Tax=Tetracentron sinense TaxID=13715 RepID=A0A835DI07_TETSI|nr:hypothetical protein HHK36_014167 [Tetracentron sinense]